MEGGRTGGGGGGGDPTMMDSGDSGAKMCGNNWITYVHVMDVCKELLTYHSQSHSKTQRNPEDIRVI